MEGKNPPVASSPEPPTGNYVESWKEIAAYLKRDIRTVQRWEKQEGLPVHRHLHERRGSVYAYPDELDAWWNNRRPKLEAQEAKEAEEAKERKKSRSKLVVAAGMVAVVLAAGYLLRERLWPPGQPVEKKVMLAVLPFENLSDDPEQEYFSDGLTEEMITQLGYLNPESLGVIARTSIIEYKGTKKGVDEIGRELGVDYVLEGSARRAGERIRVSAQLIQVNDQTHLWAESYERDIRDVLALQKEVASAIAREVKIQLTPQGQARLARAHPVDPEAHELYLKGRYFWNRRTEEGLKKSIEYFQQAIEKDPNYAASYAGIADAYNMLGNWGLLAPTETYPRAKAAASKALQIDESLAEAQIALAYATHLFDWNRSEAERGFRQALALNPNYASGHQWYAVHLATMGRFDEAIEEVKRAQELNPLSLIISDVVGWIYYLARDYDRAIEEFRKTVELGPNFYPGHYDLGMTYVENGMYEKALAELEVAVTLSGGSPRTLSGLAYAYAVAGKEAEARKLLNDLRELSRHRYVPAHDIAVIYAALGEKDEAFTWLEKAYQERHPWLIMFRVTPKVDGLRSDSRFQDLLRRLNFPT